VRASSGPDDWKRVSAKDPVKATKAPGASAKVTNVKTTDESIDFDVSEVGSPVLIRSSYFPNWEAEGAGDVYRVTPNFMVVVPTAKHVTLTYTRSNMELFSAFLSFLGVLLLLWFVVRPSAAFAGVTEFFGDRDPVDDGPSDGDPVDGDRSDDDPSDGAAVGDVAADDPVTADSVAADGAPPDPDPDPDVDPDVDPDPGHESDHDPR
jgi:hypothetical protein